MLYLMSTPSPIPSGLFYELTHGFDYREVFARRVPAATRECPDASRWTVHSWTTEQNPHMREKFRARLAAIMAANPNAMKDPAVLRNYFKAWVQLLGERVYAWNAERMTFPGQWRAQPDDRYVLGVDFGWNDAKALSQNVWRQDMPSLVELSSWRKRGILLSELAEHVREYQASYPVGDGGSFVVVGDPAHRDHFEEFRRAHGIPMIEAEKSDKGAQIEIWNSEAKAGHVLICEPESSPHVEEMKSLVVKVRPDGRRVEQPGLPNDCCDAHLMAFRHARHYLRGEVEPTVPDRRAVAEAERQRMREQDIAAREAREERAWNDI